MGRRAVGKTTIEWTSAPDGTPGFSFNAWTGCEDISPACAHCYAAAWAKRAGRDFAERRRTSESYWRQPVKWNFQAATAGTRPRVFCNSLADVFDNKVPQEWRDDLFGLIRRTSHLDWLLLTKRIGNAAKMLPGDWADGYRNVWLGSTVVTQAEVDRDVPKLLALPAAVRFLSIEPMLEPIDLTDHLWGRTEDCQDCPRNVDCECGFKTRSANGVPTIGWVICGGESGPKSRPFDISWAQSIIAQCAAAGVPCFLKQIGANPELRGVPMETLAGERLHDRKGGDWSEWPPDLRVRQFPEVST